MLLMISEFSGFFAMQGLHGNLFKAKKENRGAMLLLNSYYLAWTKNTIKIWNVILGRCQDETKMHYWIINLVFGEFPGGSKLGFNAGLQRRLSQGPSNTSGAIFYGNHMAIAMSLGFLFYGGGTSSFNSSKFSTAALVISIFPRFPLSPTDNRCHLQVQIELLNTHVQAI